LNNYVGLDFVSESKAELYGKRMFALDLSESMVRAIANPFTFDLRDEIASVSALRENFIVGIINPLYVTSMIPCDFQTP
jgi:hypothetical protein